MHPSYNYEFDNRKVVGHLVPYQGNNRDESHFARVMERSVTLSTGEEVEYSHPHIVLFTENNLSHITPLDEISYLPNGAYSKEGRNNRRQGFVQVSTPKNTHESSFNYAVPMAKRSMGQETDIKNHKKRLDEVKNKAKDEPLILFGVSRGGVTTFNALCENKYENSKIRLCILEAPPATGTGLVKHYPSKIHAGPVGEFLYQHNVFFLRSLIFGSQHKPTEHNALRSAREGKFPENIPLLIVSSREDQVVPHENSIKLALAVAADRLNNAGYEYDSTTGMIVEPDSDKNLTPVYFLQLRAGNHDDYIRLDINQTEAKRYESAVHTAYKLHGLAYIKEKLTNNENEFKDSSFTGKIFYKQVIYQAAYKVEKDLAKKQQIRSRALIDLASTLSGKKHEEQEMIISVCKAMPMYAKHGRNAILAVDLTTSTLGVGAIISASFAIEFLLESQIATAHVATITASIVVMTCLSMFALYQTAHLFSNDIKSHDLEVAKHSLNPSLYMSM